MRIRTSVARKFMNMFSILSEQTGNIEIDELNHENKQTKAAWIEKYDGKMVSESEFLQLWKYSEVSTLLNSWYDFKLLSGKRKTSTQINKYFENLKYPKSKFHCHKIWDKPEVIQILSFCKSQPTLQDKCVASPYLRSEIFYIPEFNFCLYNDREDKKFELFIQHLNSLFGEFEKPRLRSMDLSRIYNQRNDITFLSIMAIHQIAGFHGLDEIVFKGENVKEGIIGLRKRQDIRVAIDQIGPRVALSTNDFELKVGESTRLKTIAGLKQISEIFNSVEED